MAISSQERVGKALDPLCRGLAPDIDREVHVAWKAGRIDGDQMPAAVDPAHTSQTCSVCGSVDRNSRRSQAVLVCASCGHVAHADVNAAKTILWQGLPSMPVEARSCATDEAGTPWRVA